MSVTTALTAAALTGGLLLGGAVAPAFGAAPAAAAPAPAPVADAVTVSAGGEGRASAAPDMAVLTATVEATKPTAKRALAAQSAAADALLAAVRKQGIADRDVRTEGLSLNAVYQHTDRPSKLTGYQAGQSFSVKIRDITRTGAVVEAVTQAAGDAARINGVTFDVADPSALRARAREAAHADARAKAEQYARLSGRRLGRLVSLAETGSGMHRPLDVPGAAFDEGKVQVATGEIREEVTVTAVYELD
ncbi:SIMPL domain-containing protein [Streptomyces sp. ISL-100]|uniref:SIMPL domain-containing protein n=1 Tax=Streptomyces sp. ISL-100 TaxID=2819173 RepID=UPI001BE57F12|nr:SIMPL domain-containing protein [Streptomyces sp. ISL-100]MBT2400730.1 SIMPL domain-containing protein [Streptomyces sp. ISL-100]